ncbi:TetR/AcrR family transcriptional regulator C-terminal domain-containing protein [Actinomadura opuntiae]|uniref:TetR/AcrR family transcriptional regulator C-terminal domain-containing protein n=1 Tax=Actinomadura sp. OS1-43 TaxID=604315 RepID=UPI00255ABFA7|nr:TetR/AcrR family transcriptional regulator C-terminal domain-containing protein [Actinomadura sp. OS1-43]MDL4821484.1 TetR/AcrR family transcriptional regulator C-terminal domain-containing protein [Actinomadura sp. OS1-43]
MRDEETPAAPRLDRAEIVRAALELLDADGFDAFSMRRLAAALDIKSPSLYWHVSGKDELFDLLVDTVIGKCPLPDGDDGRPWDERLIEIGLDLRRVLLAHPAATRLLPGRLPFGPHGLRLADHVVGLLRRAGFDDRMAGYGYLLLMFYVTGFAVQEIAFGKGPENGDRLAEVTRYLEGLPSDRYPDLVAVAGELLAPRLTDRFEFGLRGVIDGLAEKRRPQ